MPYKTKWEPNGIIWEFYDYVTAQEISMANDEFFSDQRSDRARFQIIDASRVTGVEWEERNIREAAAYDLGAETILKNIKVAYVATDDKIIDKLEKYIDISKRLNSSWKFKGFGDMESAQEWVSSRNA